MSGSARYQRLYSERVKAGRIVLQVECDAVEWAEALIDAGFLDRSACDDKLAIERATERVIELLALTPDQMRLC